MFHIVEFPLSTVGTTASRAHAAAVLRWSVADVNALFEQPFMDLLFRAQQVHREHFNANEWQLRASPPIETGGCPDDCPQTQDRLDAPAPLTTGNPHAARDLVLFERLGLKASGVPA